MVDVMLTVPAAQASGVTIPSVVVRAGLITELGIPRGWSDRDGSTLEALLCACARACGVQLTVPGLLNFPHEPRLAGENVTGAAFVAGQLSIPEERARLAFRLCGVDESVPFGLLPWTDRKLLAFELAIAPSRIVVVDDLGLDPIGERRFVRHLVLRAKQAAAGILALRYPGTFETPSWGPTRYHVRLIDGRTV